MSVTHGSFTIQSRIRRTGRDGVQRLGRHGGEGELVRGP